MFETVDRVLLHQPHISCHPSSCGEVMRRDLLPSARMMGYDVFYSNVSVVFVNIEIEVAAPLELLRPFSVTFLIGLNDFTFPLIFLYGVIYSTHLVRNVGIHYPIILSPFFILSSFLVSSISMILLLSGTFFSSPSSSTSK